MKELRDDQAWALDELRRSTQDTEFRQIASFPRYFVGNAGTVISAVRAGRVLHQFLNPNGYSYGSLMGDGPKPKKHLVHRLVAAARRTGGAS